MNVVIFLTYFALFLFNITAPTQKAITMWDFIVQLLLVHVVAIHTQRVIHVVHLGAGMTVPR